jgi:hypothetical protein
MFVWPSILFYSLFSIFAYSTRRWAREVGGASPVFHGFLSFMGVASLVIGVGYLAWYGVSVSWFGAGLAFAVSVLSVTVAASLERILGTIPVRIGSLVLEPICAVLMLWTLLSANAP